MKKEYWENRYLNGGNSGDGSYNEYAKHKSEVINYYINKYKIKTISDFGCGDGNQISTISDYESYYGFDISPTVLNHCRDKFKNDNINFIDRILDMPESDLCMSLDVLYHIVDLKDLENYVKILLSKSKRFVLIYSTDDDKNEHNSSHIYHRKFTKLVKEKINDFKLIEIIDNDLQTCAKFYLYERKKI